MFKRTLRLAIAACAIVTLNAGDDTGLLKNADWARKLRSTHPRIIFNSDDLPKLRERAAGPCKEDFERIKKTVDALPPKAEKIYLESNIIREPDGRIRPRQAATYGHRLFKYDGSAQSMRAALVYLVTGERKYFEIARDYLKLSVEVLEETAKIGTWADWMGNFRVNMFLTYDWIYNDLTPEERREIILPILNYVEKAQRGGEFKFRRSLSGPEQGNYGEESLQWFAGLAVAGDGIDDVRAEKMLRAGADLFVTMLDYREALSAGSGLLSTSTISYTFGPYPLATFFFFHTWRSALGEDISARWMQMCDYPKWFDYSAIKMLPNGRYLIYGIGDAAHEDNLHSSAGLYLHFAQSIHFYGEKFPDRVRSSWATIKRLPESMRDTGGHYPFFIFALDKYDAGLIDAMAEGEIDYGRYFYNPGYGLLIARSGRGEDDTYTAFRFGSTQTSHQQFDELSFIIYNRGFLAIDSGSRGPTANHHMYAAQTVAHNTILIHQDKEPITPFWKPWGFKDDGKTYYNHGGQNSTVKAIPLALQSTEDFIYAAGDATASYAASKSKEVVRQFVYIKPDLFIIYDRVESVSADQKKEVLFHFQNKPEAVGSRAFRAENGGVLFVNTLLPEKASFHIEGGPGREFWASGRNWELDGGEDWDKKYTTAGKWRLEVSDETAPVRTDFLHVLKASLPDKAENAVFEDLTSADVAAVRVTDAEGTRWELRFNRKGEVGASIKAVGKVRIDKVLPNAVEKQ